MAAHERTRFTDMDPFRDKREKTRRYGRYVSDLQRLFVFHGLHCGVAEDFTALAAKLQESGAFRTDVSALARCVRDMEGAEVSAAEMMRIVALASGGDRLVQGLASGEASALMAPVRLLLDEVGGWKEGMEAGPIEDAGRSEKGDLNERDESGSSIQTAGLGESTRERVGVDPAVTERRLIYSAAMISESEVEPAVGDYVDRNAHVDVPGLREAQERLESAITELRVYLDDIDRRVGRLEPSPAGWPQTVFTPIEQPGGLQRDTAKAEGGDAGRGEEIAASVQDEVTTYSVSHSEGCSEESNAGETEECDRSGVLAGWEGSGSERAVNAGSLQGTQDGDLDQSAIQMASDQEGKSTPETIREHEKQRVADGPVVENASAKPKPELSDLPAAVTLPPEAAMPMRRRGAAFDMYGPRGTTRREYYGRLLGVASVLLAIIGTAILVRSAYAPRAPGESIRGESRDRSGSTRALDSGTGSVNEYTLGGAVQAERAGDAPGRTSPPAKREAGRAEQAKAQGDGRSTEGRGQRSSARMPVVGGRKAPPGEPINPNKKGDVGSGSPGKEAQPSKGKVRNGRAEELSAALPLSAPDRSAAHTTGEGGRKWADTEGSTTRRDAAQSEGTPLVLPPSEMNRSLISGRKPVYPPEALRQHLHGKVVLNAFLAKDGTVRRMDVVEGSDIFTKSAMAAVSWRRYKPHLVQGKPVEVQTEITVDYPAR